MSSLCLVYPLIVFVHTTLVDSAIRESMRESGTEGTEAPENQSENRQEGDGAVVYDEDLQLAMALSEQQLEEDERLRKQEEAELEEVIRLSLMDK